MSQKSVSEENLKHIRRKVQVLRGVLRFREPVLHLSTTKPLTNTTTMQHPNESTNFRSSAFKHWTTSAPPFERGTTRDAKKAMNENKPVMIIIMMTWSGHSIEICSSTLLECRRQRRHRRQQTSTFTPTKVRLAADSTRFIVLVWSTAIRMQSVTCTR